MKRLGLKSELRSWLIHFEMYLAVLLELDKSVGVKREKIQAIKMMNAVVKE